ncbi:MAG: [protein-PII] uridylyltransferase [Pseudomonadota bacterium]|nr:[protein-PII] uridylyltransferase [Pseudomonadota bacterium]
MTARQAASPAAKGSRDSTDRNRGSRMMQWRRWILPLEAARADAEPPLDEAPLVEAAERLADARDAAFQSGILEAAKTVHAAMRERLAEEFAAGRDGAVYVGRHSLGMDRLLAALLDILFKRHRGAGVALVAVGGYGRGELAPNSDIDLLFLTERAESRAADNVVEALLYLLWDLGLKVGHAKRTVADTIRASREDQTTLTGLLETRFVAGDRALAGKLDAALKREIGRLKTMDFVDAKLAERDQRHSRHGAIRYMVEPNIKEGKGGLRDLHTLFWIAKFAYRADSIIDIVEKGVLRESEARRFAAAQRFLWTVRCHLHLRAGRPEERLDFDAQMAIAPLMGFAARGSMRDVERFMKRYHLAARDVGNLTRIICAAMETDFRKRRLAWATDFRLRQMFGPFAIRAGRVNLEPDLMFRDRPLRMLEIFRLALEQNADVHPQALQRITRGLHALGESTRNDPQAAAEFLAILTSKHNPERVLRLMNESGVLGRFLPDFGKIVAMMQFDMYHSFTVDEHTIQVIGILHQIESGGLAKTAPVATAVMPEIDARRALFVAALLHDIAKGRDGDHSELGAELALDVCPRLGLTPEETETVSWLVRHHLLMSKTAFRYDLNDPKTIDDFAALVQSPERLKLLLVLTVADIRGVGPNIWNGWKAALMRDLYYQTDAVLRGADATVIAASSAEEARELARAELASWSDEEFADYAARLPRNYWTGFDTDMHVRHAGLGRTFRDMDVPLLTDFRQVAERKVTELTLLTVDDAGLFSRVAGAVAGLGINIIGARITTCTDGTVLDVFQLQTADTDLVSDKLVLERLQEGITGAVSGTLRPQAALDERWRSLPARVRRLPVRSRVILSNRISSTHTVIEINGRDFPGLLHRLTRTLADLGLQIQTATVSTYGERAVDVFYVKDLFGLQVHNQARLDTIRDRLLAVFEQVDEAAA